MALCCQCKYYLGGGDYGTCCSKSYNLCYEHSEVCSLFEQTDIAVNVTSKISWFDSETGKWERAFRCSICGFFQEEPLEGNYCPNCKVELAEV